jgi:hypothetical protein
MTQRAAPRTSKVVLPLTVAQLQALRAVITGTLKVTMRGRCVRSYVEDNGDFTDVTTQVGALRRRKYIRYTRNHRGPSKLRAVPTDLGMMRLAMEDAGT